LSKLSRLSDPNANQLYKDKSDKHKEIKHKRPIFGLMDIHTW